LTEGFELKSLAHYSCTGDAKNEKYIAKDQMAIIQDILEKDVKIIIDSSFLSWFKIFHLQVSVPNRL